MNPDDQLYVDKKLAEFEVVMLRNQRHPYGFLVAIFTIMCMIAGGLYTLIVIPIHSRLNMIDTRLTTVATELVKEQHEILKNLSEHTKK